MQQQPSRRDEQNLLLAQLLEGRARGRELHSALHTLSRSERLQAVANLAAAGFAPYDTDIRSGEP